jgi:crossover junction endodeoxyribonuclease RuvC
MTILGIDPGLERVGFGLIQREGSRLTALEYGLIQTPKIGLNDRLRLVHEQLSALIERTRPDSFATEKLLFSVNKRTAMDVAKSLGVILLAGSQHGLPWAEYTPPEVKLAVVGNGAADKKQVQYMITKLLSLRETPKPDDVADALAVAICHAFRTRIELSAATR